MRVRLLQFNSRLARNHMGHLMILQGLIVLLEKQMALFTVMSRILQKEEVQ